MYSNDIQDPTLILLENECDICERILEKVV